MLHSLPSLAAFKELLLPRLSEEGIQAYFGCPEKRSENDDYISLSYLRWVATVSQNAGNDIEAIWKEMLHHQNLVMKLSDIAIALLALSGAATVGVCALLSVHSLFYLFPCLPILIVLLSSALVFARTRDQASAKRFICQRMLLLHDPTHRERRINRMQEKGIDVSSIC